MMFACLCAFAWSRPVSAQTNYLLTDLGSPSLIYNEAHGINQLGAVVGEYEPTNSNSVLAFSIQNGALTDLGHLSGAPYAVAYGNNTNEVVGESNAGTATHAFLYRQGSMTDLGTLGLPTGGYSSAHAVNNAGQIVGEATLHDVTLLHAALFSTGGASDLGVLGGVYSSANAINNSNLVVGESDVVSQGVTNVHAFLYQSGSMQDLGTLGGSYSSGKGINDSGVVVGEAESVVAVVTNLHAFRYQAGTMADLGTLGGATSSASAVNSAGLIVGYATDSNELACAFLYTGSKMINLNQFIPVSSAFTNLSSADAINDAGQIAGSGFLADGSYHAYLLTPSSIQNPTDSPPSISITSPAPAENFQAPASFAVEVSAVDPDGAVTNVQFLVNGLTITNSSSAPFSANVTNLPAGLYTLAAVATDNAGLASTNSIQIAVSQTTTDLPPVILITNPVANATFQAPASFIVAASASDPDGSVTNVLILYNGTLVTNANVAPYSAPVSGLTAGNYTFFAVAVDNSGLSATNSLNIVVTNAVTAAAPVTILSPGFAASTFSFAFSSQPGVAYSAQANDSLQNTNGWSTFTNLLGDGTVLHVVDTNATNAQRFYRVLSP